MYVCILPSENLPLKIAQHFSAGFKANKLKSPVRDERKIASFLAAPMCAICPNRLRQHVPMCHSWHT
jgi:hypothetical protein